MTDAGHVFTEEKIRELEERIELAFRSARIDMQGKYDRFMSRYLRDDEKFRKQMEEGKITKATYRDWRRGQIFQRREWQKALRDLAETLTRTNELTMEIINDAAPEAFAQNANWASFTIEKAGNVDMGFGLYDADTVKRLLRDEPNLLPPSRVDIPKDMRWNMKQITAQINQGIIQGEKLEEIAKRLMRVADMNVNQARTHAQTAMTGAQNAGRMEQFHRAGEMGIEMEREWIAAFDGHTRQAHALLDGQTRPEGEPFMVTYRYGRRMVTDSIMYPGDPNAHPRMVYNCRCTLGAKLISFPGKNVMRRPNLQEYGDALPQKPIKDMTYAEWEGWKKKSLQNGAGNGIIYERDMDIPRSVGAKAMNYDIELPDGEIVHLTEGTRITKIQTIAGKGRQRRIDEIDNLIARWGGNAEEWQKKKGIGYIDYQDESFKAELHWYEEPTAGSHKWKVKPDADGNWFIED